MNFEQFHDLYIQLSITPLVSTRVSIRMHALEFFILQVMTLQLTHTVVSNAASKVCRIID